MAALKRRLGPNRSDVERRWDIKEGGGGGFKHRTRKKRGVRDERVRGVTNAKTVGKDFERRKKCGCGYLRDRLET